MFEPATRPCSRAGSHSPSPRLTPASGSSTSATSPAANTSCTLVRIDSSTGIPLLISMPEPARKLVLIRIPIAAQTSWASIRWPLFLSIAPRTRPCLSPITSATSSSIRRSHPNARKREATRSEPVLSRIPPMKSRPRRM